ncbi:hypothetical protein DU80_19870 [Methanosarcina mazei]|uniref:Uncharacterized protein n=1 Tax=Methanosarcina mazei TaxID=2209 RepID=A0A0F8U2X4_METMZ|nr:hypothetical protein DU47_04380 [Methanosarcina mazei]KKH85581.1 hypothetical protein DU80_19870 [Methanosarcina mazei]
MIFPDIPDFSENTDLFCFAPKYLSGYLPVAEINLYSNRLAAILRLDNSKIPQIKYKYTYT